MINFMKMYINSGIGFKIENLIIALIFLYFVLGGQRNLKETIRDTIFALAVTVIADKLLVGKIIQGIGLSGMAMQIIWIIYFLILSVYIMYVYKKRNFFISGLLVFSLMIFTHIAVVSGILTQMRYVNNWDFLSGIIKNDTVFTFITLNMEWIIIPDVIIYIIVLKLKKIIERRGIYFRKFEKNLIVLSMFVYYIASIRISDFISFKENVKAVEFSFVLWNISILNILIALMILISICFYIINGIQNKIIYMQNTENILREKTGDYLKYAKEYNENISKLMHDFKNHMTVVNLMAGNNESVQEYLKPLIEENKNKDMIMTGNNIVDIIINEKSKDMEKFNIDFDVKAAVPPEMNIDECDLAAVLFNTIDNAIEASSHVKGTRKIFIEMLVRGNKLIYSIENTFETGSGTVRNYAEKNLGRRGFGMDIVKEIIQRYNGDIDISSNGNKYNLKLFVEI